MNKEAAKKAYREAGLPVAPDMTMTREEVSLGPELARMAFHTFGAPLVVKPVNLGSSVALSIVRGKEEFQAALEAVFKLDRAALLEKYLPGLELTCAVVGSGRNITALPPIEIVPAPGRGFFDYEAKYVPGQCEEICPARVPYEITSEVQRLSANAHRALGCRSMSRSDFIFSEGQTYILETNTLPGLTSGSLIPKMVRAFGLTFTAFLSYLLDDALEKGVDIKNYL
jgi:D-alanine-D-alanine ligase